MGNIIIDCFYKIYYNLCSLLFNDSKEKVNNINNILKSKIGFYNSGGSCYMASILQILIHSKIFMNEFLKKNNSKKNTLSKKLLDFIIEIENSNKSIKIKKFSNEFNKINSKFDGYRGNNPMKFFVEFIKQLGEENKNIINIFTGKKFIKFNGKSELNYEEDFIFYMVIIDEKNNNLKKAIYQEKEFEEDENLKLSEEIIVKPEILIFNIGIENTDYNFEEFLNLGDAYYELKSINRYSNSHSIV